jgi:hypothetical protein
MAEIGRSETQLLELLVGLLDQHVPDSKPRCISYTQACIQLGVNHRVYRTPGEALEAYAMSGLVPWLDRTGKPAITGLVVNEDSWLPSKGFWRNYKRQPSDTKWYEGELDKAKKFDWSQWARSPQIVEATPHVEEPEPPDTPQAVDFSELLPGERERVQAYRILRDSAKARRVKHWHQYKCQVCKEPGIPLPGGKLYAEAHHIKPLGGAWFGDDEEWNILCVCPTCHVLLDYRAIPLDFADLLKDPRHDLNEAMIDFHNKRIYRGG